MTDTTTRRLTAAALASVLALGLAACGSDTADTADTGQTTSSAGQDSTQSGDALTFSDGYVGAKDTETSMTAVFGELTNSTDEDIHLTRATGDLEGVYQFHETVDGIMKETDDGLVVPANGSVDMEPGSTHIMIMENHDEIAAGDALTLTLTAEDGTTYEIKDIPVRVQQSAHEDYGTEGTEGADGTEGTGDEHGDHAGH
ncbi:copper chaperone PCu(A)C [Corynebacterium kalidii]|uniref:Copper chaperone PCu(A)C n=1 Tax=Corynebacterium kalidii TaxID=2931982 RepID=A0A9X2AZ69_9CORY|nr:copper chaperone PCu(A)C [Corynebacterium kalidii]MCJ7858806.1 copper chaperone PCu(A)C [Corynebacterium kalidii]